jgi:hypothetical protein
MPNNLASTHQTSNGLTQRLLSRAQAASYLNLSTSAFSGWVRRGIVPAAIPGTKRWDKKAIDAALDRSSDLHATTDMSPLDQWRSKRDAGSPSRLVRDL